MKRGMVMSTTYYICKKKDFERSEAIIQYTEKIRKTLGSYLNELLPLDLKDDPQLADDLEDAVTPMVSKLNEHIGYDPEVRLCTLTRDRVVWHWEEAAEAGFKKTDELVVIDEYGKSMPLEQFLASGETDISGMDRLERIFR